MKSLYCSLLGHNYKVSKNVTYFIKEYKCQNCSSELTTDGNGKTIPLTPQFKEINSVLHGVHEKRLERGRKLFMTTI